MFIYRISQTKYAGNLTASGIDGRWNKLNEKIIYTAGSVALACLENLAHRNGASLSSGNFSVSIIEVDDRIKIEEIEIKKLTSLNAEWYLANYYNITQRIGSDWINSVNSAILKVPSAIIDLEYNYLINPSHPDFVRIKIVTINKFTFDPRLKSNP